MKAAAAAAIAAIAFLLAPAEALCQASHPYILVKPGDLPALRTKIQAGVPKTAYDSFRNSWYTASFADGLGTASWGEYGEELALRWLMDPANNGWQGQNAAAILMDAVAFDEQAEWTSGTWIVGFAHGVAALGILYDLLYDRLTPTQRSDAVADIERCCLLLWNCGEISQGGGRPLANFSISAYAALGIASLAIQWDSTHSLRDNWLDAARDRIRDDTLRDAWNPDGSCEEDVMYMFYGSPNAVRFALGLANATGTDIMAGSNMDRCVPWLAYQWVPGGQFVPHGDAGRWGGKEFAAEFLATARGGDRALARWLWDRVHPGAVGNLQTNFCLSKKAGVVLWYPSDVAEEDPAAAGLPLGAVFRDNWNPGGSAGMTGQGIGKAGLIHMRSAWGEDAFAFTLLARDEYTYHAHNDGQTVTVDAYGERFIEDPPVRDYAESLRGATDEHSIIQVDAVKNNCEYRWGYRGEMGSAHFGLFADYARCDGRYSLGRYVRDYGDMANSVYYPWERGDRICAFVRGPDAAHPCVWMADDVKKDSSSHAFRSQIHTWKTSILGAGTAADPYAIQGASAELQCAFLAPAGVSASVEDRTFSSGTHKVIVGAIDAVNPVYLVFLYPRKTDASMASPALAVQSASAGAAAGRATWPDGAVDCVLVGPGGSTASGTSANLSGDMRMAVVRFSGGLAAGFMLGEGSLLSADGTAIADTRGVMCSIDMCGGMVSVRGLSLGCFRVLAPGAPEEGALEVNGESRTYYREGDYVVVGPEAGFTAQPVFGVAPHTVSFDASGSLVHVPGAAITAYEWDFGDGSTESSSQPEIDHVFSSAGVFSVSLTIRTDIGESDTAACDALVEVAPAPEPKPGCQCSPAAQAGSLGWAASLFEALAFAAFLAAMKIFRRRP